MKRRLALVAAIVASVLLAPAPAADASGPCSTAYNCFRPGDYCFWNDDATGQGVGIGLRFDANPLNTYQFILPAHMYYCGTGVRFGGGNVDGYYIGQGFCARWIEYKTVPGGQLFASERAHGYQTWGAKFVEQRHDYAISAYHC